MMLRHPVWWSGSGVGIESVGSDWTCGRGHGADQWSAMGQGGAMRPQTPSQQPMLCERVEMRVWGAVPTTFSDGATDEPPAQPLSSSGRFPHTTCCPGELGGGWGTYNWVIGHVNAGGVDSVAPSSSMAMGSWNRLHHPRASTPSRAGKRVDQ